MKRAGLLFTISINLFFYLSAGEANAVRIQEDDTVSVIINNNDTLVVDLEETVVTAFNRTQRLLDVAGSMTSIGQLQLEREKQSFNILSWLGNAPGVFAHEGATNTNRVSIRGIGARVPYATGKIRAFLNDIPLTNTSGYSFIQDIDPALIQNIDIIKGPATSVYGAGLGGTISITARRPGVHTSGISNSFQAGSFGLLRNSLTADLSGDKASTSLVYSISGSNGYRENNQFSRDAVSTISQLQFSDNSSITMLLSYIDLKSHIPSSIDSVTFANSPASAAENWLRTEGYEDSRRFIGGVSGSHYLRNGLKANISIFSIFHDEKEMRPFDVFYEDRLSFGSRMRLSREVKSEGFYAEITSGGEAMFEKYNYSNYENIGGAGEQGEIISDNSERTARYNLFIQADADISKWSISTGVNLNYTGTDYSDRFHSGSQDRSGWYDYGIIISPRISSVFRYSEDHRFFATLSHGFSPPSLSETLSPEGFINPDIKPEKSWNLEAGFRGQAAGKDLFYDISFYRMQVQDLLVAERVAEDAWVGRNAGESIHQGIEAEIHWLLLGGSRKAAVNIIEEVSLRANYTYNHLYFTDFTDLDDDYSGNRIPGVPGHVLNASLYSATGPGMYAMTGWRYTGRMAMNDANTSFTDAYSLLDLIIGYRASFSGRVSADIFLRVNNLADRHYASMILVNAPSFGGPPRYYYPGLPRNFRAGITLSYR